jgi:hypothetical protein
MKMSWGRNITTVAKNTAQNGDKFNPKALATFRQ